MKHCSQQTLSNVKSLPTFRELYNKINPILCDVTLRDGLQNAKVENYPTEHKKKVFQNIMKSENPPKIEVGSLTSYRILPIMKDSIEIYKHAVEYINREKLNTDVYLLVPSLSKLNIAINSKIQNYSFITSTSNAFQLRNTCRTLDRTKEELKTMFERLGDTSIQNTKKKLYISCIDQCPIVGKIDKGFIVNELLYYNENFNFDEICLSDTCGNLSFENFFYIIENATYLGIPVNKLSIHLHISNENMENIKKILKYCFENEINKFDISSLATGGCSITIENKKLLPNLSYGVFYSILYEYIYEKINL
jgi:isopropylmalate/homocitrate/citramalate synthase